LVVVGCITAILVVAVAAFAIVAPTAIVAGMVLRLHDSVRHKILRRA